MLFRLKVLPQNANLSFELGGRHYITPRHLAFFKYIFLHAVIHLKWSFSRCACVAEVMEALSIKPSGNISLSSLTSITTRPPSSLQPAD